MFVQFAFAQDTSSTLIQNREGLFIAEKLERIELYCPLVCRNRFVS